MEARVRKAQQVGQTNNSPCNTDRKRDGGVVSLSPKLNHAGSNYAVSFSPRLNHAGSNYAVSFSLKLNHAGNNYAESRFLLTKATQSGDIRKRHSMTHKV